MQPFAINIILQKVNLVSIEPTWIFAFVKVLFADNSSIF